MKTIVILFALALLACAARPPTEQPPDSPEPAARAVPEREVLALANDLVSLAGRRGFDVVALHRAVEDDNAADVCRALGLAAIPCEELGARVHAMGRRLEAAGGAVVGEASPPYRCTVDYRPCLVVSFMATVATYRFPALIAGAMTLAALRCRCANCPGGRLRHVCNAIPGL